LLTVKKIYCKIDDVHGFLAGQPRIVVIPGQRAPTVTCNKLNS